MQKPQSPCLGCEKRKPKCHGDCEPYCTYLSDLDKYKQIVLTTRKESRPENVKYTKTRRENLGRK